MSHFYGTLKGSRGEATRGGDRKSGIETYTASWEGAVCVRLWYDKVTNTDMATVSLGQWHGRGQSPAKVLYRGPVGGIAEEVYTLTPEDVGKPSLRAFGRIFPVSNFMGRILPQDVGKRVFLRGDILQVENEDQRAQRLG